MDLYTTIVGLYSQNRHEVLRVVNTAIHSKCNLSEGIEVIHTGFYCFTHTGKELEFLYDTQSQILYFQGSNSNGSNPKFRICHIIRTFISFLLNYLII